MVGWGLGKVQRPEVVLMVYPEFFFWGSEGRFGWQFGWRSGREVTILVGKKKPLVA